MIEKTDFYINGSWVPPVTPATMPVNNPATEEDVAVISMGSAADVDKAVDAATAAFETWGWTDPAYRADLLQKLSDIYRRRSKEMADAITLEMGAPTSMSVAQQVGAGQGHIDAFIKTLRSFEFDHPLEEGLEEEHIAHEPIGVCGLITPWNWPMNQVTLKVVPAVAAGCTCILKPSEIAPLSSILFAEFMDEAGFPPGVFNMINGDGPTVGEAMSAHPGIHMMSFTGSTRAGTAVSRAAAATVKRVTLELGGKSPNIVLADSNLEKAVKVGVLHCMNNTGQSCNAPTRMIVERSVYDQAVEIAKTTAEKVKSGDPTEEGRHMGPLVSEIQFNKVQALIQKGIDEGARLVTGGTGRPEGINKGYFVRPTIFADVDPDMTISREEIFGPVLAMIPVENEEEAVQVANDTPYGLAAYLQTGDQERGQKIARRLRAGMVHLNGADQPFGSPFGGYKQSGNGREGGSYGLEDFLEVKTISGWKD